MAKSKKRSDIKKIDKIVIRDPNTRHVKNVIFPNGVVIGSKGRRQPLVIHGDTFVGGALTVGGGITGASTGGTAPFLFLDTNSNVFTFDSERDTTATPATIVLSALQVSQSSTLVSSDFGLTGSDGTHLDNADDFGDFTVSATETGTSTATMTITYHDGRMGGKFPLTASVINDGLTSTKLIGQMGLNASFPSISLDVTSNVFSFDNDSDTTATPPTLHVEAAQNDQDTTIVTGDFGLTGSDGTDLNSHLTAFTIKTFTEVGTSGWKISLNSFHRERRSHDHKDHRRSSRR